MPNLSLGRLICWEGKADAEGNSTFFSPYSSASSTALCWSRKVRREKTNSTLNFMSSVKQARNLQKKITDKLCKSWTPAKTLNTLKKSVFSFLNYFTSLWCHDLTLGWSQVWRCTAARCGRNHDTSPARFLHDEPAANPRVAQMGGSQPNQVPGRLLFTLLCCSVNHI